MLSSRPNSLLVRWTVLTAIGFAVGLGAAVALGGPVQALVGMVLVTPTLTVMVGTLMGTSQLLELRSRLAHPGAWVLATGIGLGIGLAPGVVVVAQRGGRRAGLAAAV